MSDPILTSDKVLDGLARDMARLHTNGGSLPKGPYRGAQAGVRNAAYWTGRRVAKAGAEAHIRALLDAIHDSMTHESQRFHAAAIDAAREYIK